MANTNTNTNTAKKNELDGLSIDRLVELNTSGAITAIEFGIEVARRIAAAKTGTVKAFAVKADSVKGVFTITLPGMGMAIAPPAEALQSLVDNVDALRAALAKHGEERKATRASYKLTPEYRAAAGEMYSKAAASKAST